MKEEEEKTHERKQKFQIPALRWPQMQHFPDIYLTT